jgi:hypothetical protein
MLAAARRCAAGKAGQPEDGPVMYLVRTTGALH